jgi:NADPH:quinone reductase-like Zn-dependent oxidoreductase
MRTWELRGDGFETLTLVERPAPRPGPGQVRVRIRAVSLNYRDLLVAAGSYARGPAPKRPLVPCSDGAGEVVEAGPGVTALLYVGSVRHFEALNAAVARGRLRPVVDRVFPFDRAREAYAHLGAGAHVGKVVIAV